MGDCVQNSVSIHRDHGLNPNILHICSSYANQELYSQLLIELEKMGVRQLMYAPIREAQQFGENRIKNSDNLELKYSYILRKYHRVFFHLKIKTILKDLEKCEFIEDANVTHAHFLFSDGAAALKLKEKYGIPYVVSVRNTDINIFFKYLRHLNKLGNKILIEAEAIIFVTPKYIESLIDRYVDASNQALVKKKIRVIPNGLNSYWLDNINIRNRNSFHSDLRLLFVGKFTKGKNVSTIIQATKKLKSTGFDVHLTLVGGGGNQHVEIERMVNENHRVAKFLGKVKDKARLLQIYRENDIIIMPSIHETFGMVYIEAMSQGLPCIYTSGQGIDGYFKDGHIGYPVNPFDIDDIVDKVTRIKEQYEEMSQRCIREVERFNWKMVCHELLKVYEHALNP